MLHLADVHLDLHYKEGADSDCGDPLCCRAENGERRAGAGGGIGQLLRPGSDGRGLELGLDRCGNQQGSVVFVSHLWSCHVLLISEFLTP